MIRKLALLGAAAVAALAINGPSYAVGLPVTQVIWVSGSTALDNAFKHFMILAGTSPCAAGSVDTYEDTGKGAIYTKSNNYTVVACTLTAALGGFAAGSNVAFVKESNGGSVEGTTPVSLGHTLNFLDPTVAAVVGDNEGDMNCTTNTAAGAGVQYSVAHDLTFTDHSGCTGTIALHIPDVGLADENPEVYTIGPNATTHAIIGNLTTNTMFQNMFGIGVSLNLYRALQSMQGLSGTVACPANSDLLSCMPSLNKSTIRGLLAAGLDFAGWGTIISSTGVAITDKSFNGGVNNVSNQVYVCRRGDTSGTQAAADIYFLNNRCQVTDVGHPDNPTGNQFVQANQTGPCAGLPAGETAEDFGCTWTAGAGPAGNASDIVFPGTGTGDVAKCLDAHDSNPATNAAATFAIGVIATNNAFGNAGGAAGAGDYRLIAIDHNHPTVQALANGTYEWAMDNVVNVAKTGSAQAIAFQAKLAAISSNAVVIGDLISTQVGDANFGVGGLFDNYQAGAPLPTGFQGLAATKTTPTSALTQLANTNVQNDCITGISANPSQSQQVAEDAP
jgi:hypothetical protein